MSQSIVIGYVEKKR